VDVQRASVVERLRYAFDNYMARGTTALILGLFVASILLVLVIAGVVYVTGVAADQGVDFLRALWLSLLRTLDPGTMGADEGSAGFLLLMLAVTLGGIFIVATLIGILSSGIQTKLEELRKGRSRVIERDHIVILGWSQSIHTVVAELATANANRRSACIVVLADRDKVAMEDEIRSRVGSLGRVRLVCRSGSPIDLDEIDIASVQTSRSIIVLSPGGADPDADVIKTLLAITNDPNRRQAPYHVVAEIHDPRNIEVARMVGRDEVELVLVGELVARITAQTSRQPGLSLVYAELLDFAGDEIYVASVPELEGRTFHDALLLFEDSSPIGIAPDGGDPVLAPPMDRVFARGDRVVAISRDDDTVRPTAGHAPSVVEDAIVDAPAPVRRPERVLLLGWNWRATSIIRELDRYVDADSELLVVSDVEEAQAAVDRLRPELRALEIDARRGDTTDRRLLDSLRVQEYDHVVILSYSDVLDVQRADARTLVTLLHLRDIASVTDHRFSIVSEMLDVRNRSLAEVTRADDFIVSDRLVSLLLSQLAEDKRLARIFDELFDSAGSELYLRPVTGYVRTERPVTFATVVAAASRRGEVAVGFRSRDPEGGNASDRVRVNPPRSESVMFGPRDQVIVLARE
jgi:voltage-gated potassium channel Kch